MSTKAYYFTFILYYSCIWHKTKRPKTLNYQWFQPFLLEAPPGFGPGTRGFAVHCLTTWLWCHILLCCFPAKQSFAGKWSGQRDSNSLPPPWQGGALPNELCPHIVCAGKWEKTLLGFPRSNAPREPWCLRSESNQRHEDFQSSALPTELQRHIRDTVASLKWRPRWGSNP